MKRLSALFMLLSGLLVGLLISSSALQAAEPANRVAAAAGAPTVSGAPGANDLAGVAMGLLLVLGLIFALAWLFRRYGNLPSFNRSNIQVLGGVSLGGREKAVLLEVEGQRLLVGVAAGQVTNLMQLPPRSEADIAPDQSGQANQSSQASPISKPADNLSTVFAKLLKGERQATKPSTGDEPS